MPGPLPQLYKELRENLGSGGASEQKSKGNPGKDEHMYGFHNFILIQIFLKWKIAFAQRAECGPGWATLPQRLCAKGAGTPTCFSPWVPKLQKQKAL